MITCLECGSKDISLRNPCARCAEIASSSGGGIIQDEKHRRDSIAKVKAVIRKEESGNGVLTSVPPIGLVRAKF